MSFLDQLRAARRSTIAVFHEFTLLYNAASDLIHTFVEGQPDQDHFAPEIRRRAGPSGFKIYVCNGKQGVYEVLEKAEEKQKLNNRVIFIVDRDYDDFIPIKIKEHEAVYVTDYYAIENEVASENYLDYFLIDMLHMSKSDAAYGIIRSQYEELILDFTQNMREFSALTICERRSGSKVNLNNVAISHAFRIDEDVRLVTKADPIATLGSHCGIPTGKISEADLNSQIAVLDTCYYKLWLRGKYEMWLFVNFLNQVWHNLSKVGRPDGRKIHQSMQFNENNVFMCFSGRVSYRESFKAFLDSRLGKG